MVGIVILSPIRVVLDSVKSNLFTLIRFNSPTKTVKKSEFNSDKDNLYDN